MNQSDQEYIDIMNQTADEITEEDINSLVDIVTGEIDPPTKPRCKVCDNEFTDKDPEIKTVLLLNYDEKDNRPVYGEFYICRGCIYRISIDIDVMLQD